ncbi:hypothetical protein GCM10010191_21310 [Actinomadura vinacea]|uniref:Uncharacterized protein n=1 Tax=Actinomadura vinacea TaxID=115336 RepID=A0ABP5VWU5_9ACTN
MAGATAAALALWALADSIIGSGLTVRHGEQIGPGAVAVASLFAGLSGWALLAVLERVLSRPRRVWTFTALVVLALSLPGALGADGAAGTAALVGMHLIVAAVLVPGMARSPRVPMTNRNN